MRRVLLAALATLSLSFACPVSLADESQGCVPVKITDVAKGKTPSIAAGADILHVCYQNDAAIYYSASLDGGKSWSTPAKISGAGKSCCFPEIAAGSDGSVNIVYQDTNPGQTEAEIFYARSADGGKTWSEPADISNTATASSEPEIAIAPDNSVHIIWIDALSGPKCPDLYYCASKDGGKTWSRRADLSNSIGVCRNPAIGVGSDNTVHVAWLDSCSGETHPDIFYVRNAGEAWSQPKNLSNSPRESAHPSLACGPKGKVYVVWSDNSRKEKAADIWCKIAHKGGEFGQPINISNTRGISSQPVAAADKSDRLAVVWSDTSASIKVPDIWARTGYEEGFSNVLQLCQTEGESLHPAVTIANKKAYTVWEEGEAGASTIRGCFLNITMAVGPAENVDAVHYGHSR